MNKTLVRSYAFNQTGDVCVTGHKNGDRFNLSVRYADAPHPPRADIRAECCLDVFRYDDGKLCWSASPNGHDVPAALALGSLIALFADDVEFAEGDPRAF